MRTSPEDGVKTAIEEAMGVDREDIAPASSIIEELGTSSIDILDIQFRVRKETGVDIPIDTFHEEGMTVQGLIDLVEAQATDQPPPIES